MHLLYVDDSGHPQDPNQDWFVLAGVSLFKRQCFWLSEGLERIAERFNPAESSSIELHGAEMRNGKTWRHVPPADRVQAIKDALDLLAKSHPSNRIFAVAVRKGSVDPRDPVDYAFEQLSSRFDQYLRKAPLAGRHAKGSYDFRQERRRTSPSTARIRIPDYWSQVGSAYEHGRSAGFYGFESIPIDSACRFSCLRCVQEFSKPRRAVHGDYQKSL